MKSAFGINLHVGMRQNIYLIKVIGHMKSSWWAILLLWDTLVARKKKTAETFWSEEKPFQIL